MHGYLDDVTGKGAAGESRIIYIIVAFIIVIIVVFAVILSTRQLTPAYVPDDVLINDGWAENLTSRDEGSHLLGLEKWCSLTYDVEGRYPAYLTVTTYKTLLMMDENELMDKTTETIKKALQHGIAIDNSSESTKERVLKNEHKTTYIIYSGNDTTKDPHEKIKIIGEAWNCGTSGTSIICIGLAQITDYAHNNPNENTAQWEKIVRDRNGMIDDFAGEDGLIYNVICH